MPLVGLCCGFPGFRTLGPFFRTRLHPTGEAEPGGGGVRDLLPSPGGGVLDLPLDAVDRLLRRLSFGVSLSFNRVGMVHNVVLVSSKSQISDAMTVHAYCVDVMNTF